MASKILFSGDRLEFTADGTLFIADDGEYSYDEVEPEDVQLLYEAMKKYFDSAKEVKHDN